MWLAWILPIDFLDDSFKLQYTSSGRISFSRKIPPRARVDYFYERIELMTDLPSLNNQLFSASVIDVTRSSMTFSMNDTLLFLPYRDGRKAAQLEPDLFAGEVAKGRREQKHWIAGVESSLSVV
jgi:hypothetical protein